jgi:hypothetical protein
VAAQKGRAKVVELLVAAGAPVDAAVEQVTALEAAVHAGHMRCAQVLIAAHAHITLGGQIRAREESEALKWLQKAQQCLAETDEPPVAADEESQRLVLFRTGAMKKKDLAVLSKKEIKLKYAECLKVRLLSILLFFFFFFYQATAKVGSKLQHAEECLAQEREAARREIANWKMAYMMASAGFALPPEEEPKGEPVEEVGANRKDSDTDL